MFPKYIGKSVAYQQKSGERLIGTALFIVVLLLQQQREGQKNTRFPAQGTLTKLRTRRFSCMLLAFVMLSWRFVCTALLALPSTTAGQTCNLQKFHFPTTAIGHPQRYHFATLPKPTFDCCVVGFDVFKEPVPIDLVTEAEHRC